MENIKNIIKNEKNIKLNETNGLIKAKLNTKTINFQILEWWAKDESDDDDESDEDSTDGKNDKVVLKYNIYCFGKTEDDKNITCKIVNYQPFYYIKVDDCMNIKNVNIFLDYIEEKLSKIYKYNLLKNKCEFVYKKDIYGFRNDKNYKFIKLVFSNVTCMRKSKYFFKHPISIYGIHEKKLKYKLYESSFEPYLRFCHINNIQTANWVTIKNIIINEATNTKLSCIVEHENVEKKEETKIVNYLQASWDIEVYSFDGSFPEAKKKQNVIYQMATTFKYFNDTKVIKHLLTLKKCSDIISTNQNEEIIVEYYPTEKELLMRWIHLIRDTDPDIIYTYNGDGFDWLYICQRCDILGIQNYLFKQISRLKEFPAEIKKEVFSSSAYGDNGFNRIYIPGRLNYDLLIHYKRGLKKYSSYKLDFISNEILKESKNDISPKQIFSYYEEGCPEKLKLIGEYCIQDTYLLQKLVDKQLILISIIQLANVTYVPVSYLLSKGQTIKVTSQILRKAREMNFLVPDTNFNEDSYPVQLKLKDPISDIFIINDFIKIESKEILNPTSMYEKNSLNCKISEIIDESNIIIMTNIEIEKIYSYVSSQYKNKKIIFEKMYSINELQDDSFTGACVLSANIGFIPHDVAVLDFASLYPTSMISRNICYSTLVMHDKFKNCDNTKYETMEWSDTVEYKLNHMCKAIMKSGKRKNEECGKQAYFHIEAGVECGYFCRIHDPLKKTRDPEEKYQKKNVEYNYTVVQPSICKDGTIKHKGVLPSLLEDLYSERKKVKKQMVKAASEGNQLLANILDQNQLGIKVSLNSVYGFLGRKQGNLVLKELGSIVTAIGRELIITSKKYAENHFIQDIQQKHKNLLTHKINYKDISHLSNSDKNKILQKFKI